MEAMIWIGLIILFVVVEIATVGLTSIWFAGGALISLILCLCGVGLGWQIGVFFVVSLVLVAFTRPWAVKYLKPHLIRTNYEQAIGENVCLTETVDNQRGTGTAVYKGQEWTARASEDGKRYEAGTYCWASTTSWGGVLGTTSVMSTSKPSTVLKASFSRPR